MPVFILLKHHLCLKYLLMGETFEIGNEKVEMGVSVMDNTGQKSNRYLTLRPLFLLQTFINS